MSGGDPSARARRYAFLAAGALAVAAGGVWGLSAFVGRGRPAPARSGFEPPTQAEIDTAARAEHDLARAERRGLERSTVLAPDEGRLDAGSGEVVRRFQGFGVSVESEPEGARVLVNGTDLGETPLVASVACEPGEAVVVRASLPGRREARRTTTCRADALVELRLVLGR
jgi:hypothetical protein